jgi:hypothetical protein
VTDFTVPAEPPPGIDSAPASGRRGRPLLGGICGFLFGLFVGLDLLVLGVVPLNSGVLTILPVLGLVVGVVIPRLRA